MRVGPLYIFAKPPKAILPDLARLRAGLGIESHHSLDRLHSIFLMLGASAPETIAPARNVLNSFAVSGIALPGQSFGLHLNLDYGNPSDRAPRSRRCRGGSRRSC